MTGDWLSDRPTNLPRLAVIYSVYALPCLALLLGTLGWAYVAVNQGHLSLAVLLAGVAVAHAGSLMWYWRLPRKVYDGRMREDDFFATSVIGVMILLCFNFIISPIALYYLFESLQPVMYFSGMGDW